MEKIICTDGVKWRSITGNNKRILSEIHLILDRISHRLSFDIHGKFCGLNQHVTCLSVIIRSLLRNCYISITVYIS